VAIDARYIGYARETALCVDLAYIAMEQDLLTEIDRLDGQARDAFDRVLRRLRERRAALTEFTALSRTPTKP
jgi:hypothetical protein